MPDPYRWLENASDTAQFVHDQNALTNSYIRSNPEWAAVNASFASLYDYTKYGLPTQVAGQAYYMSINDGLKDQAIIYRFPSLDQIDTGSVFIDPNGFSSDGTSSLVFMSFSQDGEYCAYGISDGGSDWIKIKIKKVSDLTDLPEQLVHIKFGYVGWNKKNDGFFYTVSLKSES